MKGKLHEVVLMMLSGEFGVVYKAHLQWHIDAANEGVAVKTMKVAIYLLATIFLAHL